jgi:putative MFS transporter
MIDKHVMLDEAPATAFHRRLTLLTGGGPFCDGYILGIIAIALAVLSPQLRLNAVWDGLIGSSALIGIFFGGIVFGYVTDLVGRRLMYTIDLVIFVVGSILQAVVQDAWQLFVLRLIMGMAIGADYPIATALLAEFTPKRLRGPLLATLVGGWWVGYAVSFVVGYILLKAGVSWRVMLASSLVPAALVLLLRIGTPESPRWLLSKGRRAEAVAVAKKYVGATDIEDEAAPQTDYFRIFRGGYLRRTIFVSLFWICQTLPGFAIYTFDPQLMASIKMSDPYLGTVIISVVSLVGVAPAIFLVNSWGRRPVLIWPFLLCGLALLALGVFAGMPPLLAALLFVVFSILSAGSSVLQYVYPNELFPTEVRATGVGFATAMSRIGASIGTFLLPVMLSAWGITPSMIVFAAVCGLGLVISLLWAPETKGMSLLDASLEQLPAAAPRPARGSS